MKSILQNFGEVTGCILMACIGVAGLVLFPGAQAYLVWMWWHRPDLVGQVLPGLSPLAALFIAPTAAGIRIWLMESGRPFEGAWQVVTTVALVVNVGSLVGGSIYKMAESRSRRRTEAVNPNPVYAGFSWRLAACALDCGALILIPSIPSEPIQFVAMLHCFVLVPAMTGGTPGKAILGLRIVGTDGRIISPGRTLGRLVAFLFTQVVSIIWFLFINLDGERRSLPDRIARTRVIRAVDS